VDLMRKPTARLRQPRVIGMRIPTMSLGHSEMISPGIPR
jgi:hypothetical protein